MEQGKKITATPLEALKVQYGNSPQKLSDIVYKLD